jgi:hypothetical protein
MHRGYKMVKDCVRHNPLPLADLKDYGLIRFADSLLPYSSGVEIECAHGDMDAEEVKQWIGVLDSYNNHDCAGNPEVHIRIAPGIKGMIALYKYCELLKEKTALNPRSGIHYHIDCFDIVDMGDWRVDREIKKHSTWILKALESWKYKGEYNEWTVDDGKVAVRIHSGHQTMEFRIGEMTFEYELMMKRILHCQNIVRKLKASLMSTRKAKVRKYADVYAQLNETKLSSTEW